MGAAGSPRQFVSMQPSLEAPMGPTNIVDRMACIISTGSAMSGRLFICRREAHGREKKSRSSVAEWNFHSQKCPRWWKFHSSKYKVFMYAYKVNTKSTLLCVEIYVEWKFHCERKIPLGVENRVEIPLEKFHSRVEFPLSEWNFHSARTH